MMLYKRCLKKPQVGNMPSSFGYQISGANIVRIIRIITEQLYFIIMYIAHCINCRLLPMKYILLIALCCKKVI